MNSRKVQLGGFVLGSLTYSSSGGGESWKLRHLERLGAGSPPLSVSESVFTCSSGSSFCVRLFGLLYKAATSWVFPQHGDSGPVRGFRGTEWKMHTFYDSAFCHIPLLTSELQACLDSRRVSTDSCPMMQELSTSQAIEE